MKHFEIDPDTGYAVAQRPFHPYPQKWFEVDPPNGDEPSSDVRYFERVMKGPRLSDRTRELLSKWLEHNNWDEYCGCPGDCCGCQCRQRAAWTYSAGQLVLSITKYFNY